MTWAYQAKREMEGEAKDSGILAQNAAEVRAEPFSTCPMAQRGQA
jgi:hypothetical protein